MPKINLRQSFVDNPPVPIDKPNENFRAGFLLTFCFSTGRDGSEKWFGACLRYLFEHLLYAKSRERAENAPAAVHRREPDSFAITILNISVLNPNRYVYSQSRLAGFEYIPCHTINES